MCQSTIDHDTTKCPLIKGQINDVKCCNCSESPTANFRGCPKIPRLNRSFNYTSVTESKSYANVIKQPLLQHTPSLNLPVLTNLTLTTSQMS